MLTEKLLGRYVRPQADETKQGEVMAVYLAPRDPEEAAGIMGLRCCVLWRDGSLTEEWATDLRVVPDEDA
jgi:hypothetical protein